MKNLETSSPLRTPTISLTVVLGMTSGMLACVVTIGCFYLIGVFLFLPIEGGQVDIVLQSIWRDLTSGTQSFLSVVLVLALMTLLTSLSAIIPAISGGGIIAYVLHALMVRRRVTMRATIITGTLVGLSMGWIVSLLILPATPVGEWLSLPRPGPFWGGLAGVCAGVLDSYLMGAWLKRRTM